MKSRVSMLSSRCVLTALAAATGLILMLPTSLRAAVTNLGYWRLGENDPGAVVGVATETTVDFNGSPVSIIGSYFGAVSSSARTQVGSQLSVHLNSGGSLASKLVSTLTDNFGIELWVLPDNLVGNQCLAYNGSTDSSGWGLYLAGGRFQALYGGVSLFPANGASATPNVWTHLALVRDNGSSILYVNGVAVVTNTAVPRVPVGQFAMAAPPQSAGADLFSGALDEVRVFSFAPGGFSTNDLLYFNRQAAVATTVPPTSTDFKTATLQGSVHPGNLETLTWFEWGPTPSYGQSTATNTVAANYAAQSVNQTLVGLVAGSTYHYRVAARNALGVSYGADAQFTTLLFANVTSTAVEGTKPLRETAVAWGDYDNDGRLDFLLTGKFLGTPITQLWRNTGSGFADVTASVAPGLPGVYDSSLAWVDFDNDGRLDFFLTGSTRTKPISQLWRNTGSGFVDVTASVAPGLPGLYGTGVEWGDYDNDGRLDLLLTGASDTQISQLWRNTGSGFVNVTASATPGLPGVAASAVAWGDYDNDGRLDFLLTGYNGTERISRLWRNTGSGFVDVTASVAPGLPGVNDSSVAWGDYDNDGYLDFLIAGDGTDSYLSQLWRNTGSGFVNVTASVVPGMSGAHGASLAWGDYDNDGRLDFLLAGDGSFGEGVFELWRNTGSGFVNVTSQIAGGFSNLAEPAVAWGDYDNDGRLDFLVAGTSGEVPFLLWRNNTAITTAAGNTPPTAPVGLGVVASGTSMTFSWDAASDSQTPANGLAYFLRAGTTPGGSDLTGSMAATSGQARLPRTGALRPGRSQSLNGLPLGKTIYWSVQSADNAFAASPFAPEQSFTLGLSLTPGNGIVVPGDTNGDGVVSKAELNTVLGKVGGGLATINAAGYYTLSQVQALNIGTPLLRPVNGQFKLTLGIQKATQPDAFVAFPFIASQTSINAEGELEFLFTSPDNAAFYRLQAK